MKKKLQVFISSTYTDLIEERQAAVEAILNAGHIPAGMELFKASNESQLDTVQRWIDESDVYLLILGGRYGSIEPKSGKSYTHLEYEYALEKGMPYFAIVMEKEALNKKVMKYGLDVSEQDNPAKLKEFKELATSKMCKFFEDNKDIKMAILSSIQELEQRHNFSGWVSGKELEQLLSENMELKKQIEKIQSKTVTVSAPPQQIHIDEENLDKKQYDFLKAIYEATGGRRNDIVMMNEVGEHVGIDMHETELITSFLEGEGYIEHKTLGGGIAITHTGVLFMQKTIKKVSQLNELEKVILKEFYEKDYNATGIPQYATFQPFLKDQVNENSELAYHLIKMERNGLLDFDNDPFIKGGRQHPKFNNNVINVMLDHIVITLKGADILNYI